MHLLVLGGTAFVGRTIVEEALARGWRVTIFNRGITSPDVVGVQAVRGDRGDVSAVERLATSGPWDAVVDTTGYVPRNALVVARELAPVVRRYVLLSTVSAYADWPSHPLSEDSALLLCPVDAGPDFGQDVEDGPTRYGYQKAGCERAVRLAVGDDRVSVLRPGVILGPCEYVGRLPWWLRRVARGGRIVAPGQPERSIQPIDVRDVAEFALRCAERPINGAFNLTAPIGRDTLQRSPYGLRFRYRSRPRVRVGSGCEATTRRGAPMVGDAALAHQPGCLASEFLPRRLVRFNEPTPCRDRSGHMALASRNWRCVRG